MYEPIAAVWSVLNKMNAYTDNKTTIDTLQGANGLTKANELCVLSDVMNIQMNWNQISNEVMLSVDRFSI